VAIGWFCNNVCSATLCLPKSQFVQMTDLSDSGVYPQNSTRGSALHLAGNYRPHTSWPSGALSQTATSDSGPGPRMCHYHLSWHRLYAITQHHSALLSVVRSPHNRACVYIPSLAHESVNGQAFVGSTHCFCLLNCRLFDSVARRLISISFVNRPIFRTLRPGYSSPFAC
jgi:hypothetical protein